MKQFNVKALPAAVFTLCLLALFALGVRAFLVSAYVGSDYLHSFSAETFDKTEKEFNDSLPTRTLFLDINSFFDRITGKRVSDEYVKLDNGVLAYVGAKENVEPCAAGIAALSEYMSNTVKKPFLYVQFPFQIDPDDEQLPPGVEDHVNENADAFMALLEKKSVPVYDFRPYFRAQPDYYSLFYRTDHHWKAETAFDAACRLMDALAEKDASYTVDERVTQLSSYRIERRDDFLGSIGRHMGLYYCGYESFSAISPKFELDLTVYDENGKEVAAGGAENTVLFPEKLTYENHYLCDMYSYYMEKDHGCRRFVNRTSGLQVAQKKLLIVKDSYARAFLPYMIYGYSDVTVVDLRYADRPLTQIIRANESDLVIVAYNPGALAADSEKNMKLFRFFEEQP